jgi:hypothetical protein
MYSLERDADRTLALELVDNHFGYSLSPIIYYYAAKMMMMIASSSTCCL